jgi:hypothetical protein
MSSHQKRSKSRNKSIKSRSKSRSKSKSKAIKSRSKSRSKSKIEKSKVNIVRSKSKSRSKKMETDKAEVKKNTYLNIRPICPFDVQFFSDLTKELKYDPKITTSKYGKHVGQRKLFCTELYFLAKYGHLSNIVLYVGAAPGIHLPILSQFFPNHTFINYDNQKFGFKESEKFKIVPRYFNDDDANSFAGKDVLFICDIRNLEKTATAIIEDMKMQKRWIDIMKPSQSMLKFRMPFETDDYCKTKISLGERCTINYFDGELLLQPWARIFSTEMRLIVPTNPVMKEYDISEIEHKMFYLNHIIRNTAFTVNDKKTSWDFAQESAIVRFFKIRYPKYVNVNISDILNKHLYKEKY